MMNMPKHGSRIAALMLALVLTLCGCGAAEEPGNVPKEPQTTAEPTVPAEEPQTAAEEPAVPEEKEAELAEFDPDFTFSAVDVISGREIDETVFREHTVTMVNIWEPWCGPCVGEMPELEQLYEDMRDNGIGILGVYYTEEGAAEVLEDCGITYPVIRETPEFYQFESGYVPTSFFVDSDGHVLKSDMADARGILFISSNSYAGWKSIFESLMSDGEA